MDEPVPDAVMKVARALVEGGFVHDETSPEAPAFYKVREIADIVGVDDSTVYRWIDRGVLHAYKFEDSVRVAAEDFEAYKRRCRIQPVRNAGPGSPEAVALWAPSASPRGAGRAGLSTGRPTGTPAGVPARLQPP